MWVISSVYAPQGLCTEITDIRDHERFGRRLK